MTIPKKLKIGGHTYKVRTVRRLAEVAKEKAADGLTNFDTGIIEINAERMRSHQEQTLIHEIFHVLNSEVDHVLLDSLAQQFYQVLADNNMLR